MLKFLDISGNRIGVVFFITAVWMFVGVLLYLRFDNVCVDSSYSSMDKFKTYYYIPLIIAAMASGSILLSFIYNKSSGISHKFVLLVLTFIIVWFLNTIYINLISGLANQDICPMKDGQNDTDHWKSSAKQSGILMGISMVGVLMALIITWFMFKNEYFNFGKVDNSNSNSNSSSSSSYFNSDINFFD
jgi:hypothetical protein